MSLLSYKTANMRFETDLEYSDDQSSVKSDDQASLKSIDSPRSNRVKFLYGYGGRILPRPGDGKLRYVGGETRVMAADRNISFADLIAKMADVSGSSVVLKCQLPTDDLDALVSIKSDEDLENMLEEYERLGVKEGSDKVRAFLFPKPSRASKPPVAAPLTVARSAGGHMDRDSQPNGHITSSILRGWSHVSQEPHGLGNHSCPGLNPCRSSPVLSPRGSHPTRLHVHEPAVKAGRRPTRFDVVTPEMQYNNTTQIYDMLMMPPKQNSAREAISTAYVDDMQRVYRYTSAPPPVPPFSAEVPFPWKAAIVPAVNHFKRRAAYKQKIQNPNYGGGFEGCAAPQQLLVQH